MAKVELFKNPIVGWVVKHLYGFPVKRGKGDTSAIDYGEKIIKEGHVMAICPEGRRVKDKNGVPQRAKSGVAVIAKATNASVLPCAIYCDGPIKPGKRLLLHTENCFLFPIWGLIKRSAARMILRMPPIRLWAAFLIFGRLRLNERNKACRNGRILFWRKQSG